MRRIYFSLTVLVFVIFCFVSCDSELRKYTLSSQSTTQREIIDKFGDANRIINAENVTTAQTRFYTGQTIVGRIGYKSVTFEANLVEYNSIDPTITSYVEGIEEENALLHQGYPDLTYDSIDVSKTYVEVASYKNDETGNIVYAEVRIMNGQDFKDTWNGVWNGKINWYAKAVMFSPDFVVDVDRNINIRTGEKAYYHPEEIGKVEYNNSVQTTKTDEGKDLMFEFGDVSKVYVKYDTKAKTTKIKQYLNVDDDYYTEHYLVEYNSLNNLAQELFEKAPFQDCSICTKWTWINCKKTKKYIEFNYWKEGDDESMDIRLVKKINLLNIETIATASFSPNYTLTEILEETRRFYTN